MAEGLVEVSSHGWLLAPAPLNCTAAGRPRRWRWSMRRSPTGAI